VSFTANLHSKLLSDMSWNDPVLSWVLSVVILQIFRECIPMFKFNIGYIDETWKQIIVWYCIFNIEILKYCRNHWPSAFLPPAVCAKSQVFMIKCLCSSSTHHNRCQLPKWSLSCSDSQCHPRMPCQRHSLSCYSLAQGWQVSIFSVFISRV
jgi:hypothetical protein